MRFTGLHLTGFKSFVDPTVLPIEPGLTGVVGPNGCGKSNLVEALRWVLGETSPKAMRGGEMDDVIFAGTTKRPPRPWAEVGLDIDNSSRRAPAGLNDSDILRVTRRIVREHGSVYKVNGKEHRARDVHTMFADVATGADSPALVRQGRISELINAKPQNRRLILEEAAGTAGLHARRHEAELRLRAAETNLVRLDDVMQQIELSITQLKRQARQATRYRNLAKDIRKSEAILLHLKWMAAKSAVETAEVRLKEAQAVVVETSARVAQADAAAINLSEKLPPLRQAEAEAAAKLQRLTLARDGLEAEAKRASARLEALAKTLAETQADLAREGAQARDAEQALARLDGEAQGMKAAALGEGEALARAQTLVGEKSQAVVDAEAQFDALSGRIAALVARRQSLMRDLDGAKRHAERLDADKRRLDGELASLGAADEADQRAGALAKVAQADERVEQLRLELADIETTRAAALSAEAQARQTASGAQAALARLKGEEQTLSRLLDQGGPAKWPGLVDQLSVEPGLERALGAVLGDDLSAALDPAAPTHWQNLGPLADLHPLPTGVRCFADHVTAPPALARRLSQIGLVDDDQGAGLSAQLRPGQRLVSAKGAVWRWDGYVSAPDAPSTAARRLEQRNRLKDITAERESAAIAAQDAAQSHEAAAQSARSLSEREQTLRREVKALDDAAAQARREAADIERRAAHKESRRQAIGQGLERLVAELADAQSRLAAAEGQLAGLESEEALRQDAQRLRGVVEAARHGLSDARAALEGLKREAHVRAQRLTRIADERTGWSARIEGSSAQIKTLNARLANVQAEQEGLKDEPARIERERLTLAGTIQDAALNRSQAAETLSCAERALAEADKAAKHMTELAGEAREVRAHSEGAVQTARDRLVDVETQIRDVLDCPPNQALLQVELEAGEALPALEVLDTRLDRLKRERDAMGPVNLRADVELDEKETELAGLNAEKADLEAAIAKLKGAIQSLNKEGRERLSVAFGKVDANFRRLFTHLFNGGEAHLSLSESDDPLESGLEIFASPPGKKMQNLSLLSGGEQTLTALALIFAVFLTNPAPICVLDEVDAPLDDANVERYCNLLDEMTRLTETRFLVITHHGITMARMNRLFGVTMMERGISQLVSVDLGRTEGLRAVG